MLRIFGVRTYAKRVSIQSVEVVLLFVVQIDMDRAQGKWDAPQGTLWPLHVQGRQQGPHVWW